MQYAQSTLCGEEEQRDGAGAGVRADDRADDLNDDLLRMQTLLHQLCKELRIFLAVAVADKDGLLLRTDRGLFHAVNHGGDHALSAAGLVHGNQMASVVCVQQRLDAQRRAQNGGGGRNAAAALEKVQIIHGEPVRQMVFGFLGVLCGLLDRCAGLALLCRQAAQQEAQSVSTFRIFRSGYFSRSSSAAMQEAL